MRGPVGPTAIEVALSDAPYPVLVGDGFLDGLGDHLDVLAGASTALVVTQQPVIDAGHVAPIEAALEARGIEVVRHLVPDGEVAKDVAVLAGLWDAAADAALSRRDVVVAVGGGVVGDLAGFAAATYNRGISVLQVPTTLLAQVDAAIGGKTGINLAAGKNLVGAFHQPVAVVCDVATLDSLSPRLLIEGLGEVIKCGLIADPRVLELLESLVAQPSSGVAGSTRDEGGGADGSLVVGPDVGWLDRDVLLELVRRSVAVKAEVVAADEREGGIRAYLNLGHTYGHAVESLTGYSRVLHGEAVAIGTVVALRIGARLGRTPEPVVARGEELLAAVGLPTRGPRLDREAAWRAMTRDKKAAGGQVRFVVLDDLAQPTVVVPDRAVVDEVLDALVAPTS